MIIKAVLLKTIKNFFKHFIFNLMISIFKKYFNPETQEEYVVIILRDIVLSTENKKDDEYFNVAFGNTKFKIKLDEERK